MHPRTRLLAVVVAAAALAAPATAAADSIVYIDHGNVWSARPDGSHKVQLTDGGNWHSPTQADDGTIAAVQGTGPIQIMARDGRPLRTITTPAAPSSDGGTFAPRPVQLAFTPDGSRLAYTYIALSCPVASSCGGIPRSTFYTDANVANATPHEVWGNQFGVENPEWITNDRALVFGGSGSQVSLDDLGGGDYSFTPWMTPSADQGDGELSRDGKRLVTTFFYGNDLILAWFAVSGDARTGPPPADPAVACTTDAADPKFADPSFSPDGTATAFQSSKGIEIYRFTSFGVGTCATAGDSVLTATGSSPDWGPADPPAARWVAPQQPDAPQQPHQPTSRKLSVVAAGAKRQAFRGTLSVACKPSAAAKCAATVTVKIGRKTYRAKASRSVAGGRSTTVKVRFSAKATKAIRAALRRKRLKATVVLKATAGGQTSTARRTISLKR